MHADCDPEVCVHRWVTLETFGGGGGYLVSESYACGRKLQLPMLTAAGLGAIVVECHGLAQHKGGHYARLPDGMPFIWPKASD